MNYIVYKTTNLLNGRFYVGVHNSKNSKYLGTGTLLKRAIAKYKRENFIRETLIECGEDWEEAYSIESILVKTVKEDPRSYNLEPGGRGNRNLGQYAVSKKIGIHAASFEDRSRWQIDRIKNSDPEVLKKNSSIAGSKCAELGKCGFQTMSSEDRLICAKKAQETKLKRGIKSHFQNSEFQREMGARGGKLSRGVKTYNDGVKEYKFKSSDPLDIELTLKEFDQFIKENPTFTKGRVFHKRSAESPLKGAKRYHDYVKEYIYSDKNMQFEDFLKLNTNCVPGRLPGFNGFSDYNEKLLASKQQSNSNRK